MELRHDFTVRAPVGEAWATLTDLERVGGCFPGAVVTDAGDEVFAGTVKVRLGPVALQYAGDCSFVERDDVAHRAVIRAKGKDRRGNGTANASVTIELAPEGDGTRVTVGTDLSVTGKPAQFGRGVMQDVSDRLLEQFVACLERQFAPQESAAQPAPAAALPDAPALAATGEPIDLGATALPALARRYGPYAVAALAGLVLGWLLGRRG